MKAIFTTLLLAMVFVPQVIAAQNPIPLPSGPYEESCSECVKRANLLSCSCNTKDGNQQKAELDYESCLRDIINDDGVLKCLPEKKGICRTQEDAFFLVSKSTYLSMAIPAACAGIVLVYYLLVQFVKEVRKVEGKKS